MKRIKRISNLVCGIFIIALTFNLILLPNDLVVEDVTGLSLLYSKVFQINPSLFILFINIYLLIIAFFILGKKETLNSFWGAMLMPLFIFLTKNAPQYLDIKQADLLAQAIFAGIMLCIGYRMLFNNGFTSGGTDVVNKIISKVFNVSFGASAIFIDGLILISGGIVFSIEKMAYAIIIFTIILLFANQKIDDLGANKVFYINTLNHKKIKRFLIDTYDCDVTLIESEKGFSKGKGQTIMSVVPAKDYAKIKNGILAIDKKAFITISNSYSATNQNNKLFARKNKPRC